MEVVSQYETEKREGQRDEKGHKEEEINTKVMLWSISLVVSGEAVHSYDSKRIVRSGWMGLESDGYLGDDRTMKTWYWFWGKRIT